jgi:hypothetical protein
VLEQDGGAVTADNVQEGGGERLQRAPGPAARRITRPAPSRDYPQGRGAMEIR